jgi:hypothetical protein
MSRPITTALALSLLLALPAVSRAQEDPLPTEKMMVIGDPEPEPDIDTTKTAAPEQPCPEDEVPKAYWNKAMNWVDGRYQKSGRLLLRDITREYPDTPWGKRAADWLEENEGLDRSGRVEFISGSTLLGAYFGMWFPIGFMSDANFPEGQTIMWSSFAGGVVGLGASALASSRLSISDSQAQLYNFAWAWGGLNAFLAYDLLFSLEDEDAITAGAIGMLGGAAASLALWKHLDVPEGQAYFSTLTTLYAMEMLFLANFAIGGNSTFDENEKVSLLSLIVPSNAALVGSFFLWKKLRWTASDVRYISLGGLLGNLLGGAILASVEPDSPEAGAWTMLGSVAGSLTLATVIVRPWNKTGDAEDLDDASPALVHVGRRGIRINAPIPSVIPVAHNGETGIGVNVPLLSVSL